MDFKARYKPMEYRFAKRIVVAFLLLLFFTPCLFAQQSSLYVKEGYIITHWDTEDGLPVNSVNKIIQDQTGYLWLATNDGLVRFDGVKFTVYKSWQYPGIHSNRIDNMVESADSTLWLATEQQYLIKFKDGDFTTIRSSHNFYGNYVHQLYKDETGRLWIGTDKGLNVYEAGSLHPFQPEMATINGSINRIFSQANGSLWFRDGKQIYRLQNDSLHKVTKSVLITDATPFYEDLNQTAWFATRNGLYRFKNNKLSFITGNLDIIDITGHKDTLWLATRDKGFYNYANGKLVKTGHGEGTGHILSGTFIKRNGHLWKATDHTLYRDSTLILKLPADITDFMFDTEGNLWIATFADGLYRVKPNLFTIYSEEDGLPLNIVYPVLADKKQNIWVGTHGEGIAKISDGEIVSNYSFEGLNGSIYVRSLWQKKDGTILAGLLGEGIYALKPGQEDMVFKPFLQNNILDHSTPLTIYEDRRQQLWVGTNNGLFLIHTNKTKRFLPNDKPAFGLIRYITEAPNGDLWFATNGKGILRYDGETFSLFKREDGLSSNFIRKIFIEKDKNGNYILWLGSEDGGLIRMVWNTQKEQINHILTIDKQDGLYDNVIHNIIDDGNGNYWMSTNRGIFRVSRQELNAFVSGKTDEIHSIAYTEADGLLNREGNGGMQPAGAKTADGRLWFPTQGGVVVIDPAEMETNNIPAKPVIEQLAADTLAYAFPDTLKLDAHHRNFSIHYTGLSFTAPQKIRFRYKLQGLNEKWIEAGTRRAAFFTNIPPGEYTFKLLASNNNGVWSETPATMTLTVAPFFYETNWFLALCIALVFGAFFSIIQLRTRRLKKAEKALQAKVSERTAELESEKLKTEQQAEQLKALDEAKSRFFANISHEFRTPLTLILNPLEQLAGNGKSNRPAAEKKQFKMMMRNGRRLLRLINQVLDLVKLEAGSMKLHLQTIHMDEFAEEAIQMFQPIADKQEINLTFDHEPGEYEVTADYEKMEQILGNLLSNAIKFTSPGGSITVRVKAKDGNVFVEVEDTGIGVEKGKLEKIFDRFYQVDDSNTRSAEGLGIGLAFCKELAELHSGNLTAKSISGAGTTFTLTLKKGINHLPENTVIMEKTKPGFAPDNEVVENESQKAKPKPIVPKTYTRPEDRTTILVVDDNRDMRRYIKSVIEKKYDVITATDGHEGLLKVEKELPDIIIADVMMPEMDGLTFNKKLKENRLWQNIPVIFLTARAGDANRIKGLQEGGDAYITKPFNVEVLISQISNLLASRQRLRRQFITEAPTENTDGKLQFIDQVNTEIAKRFADPDFTIADLAQTMACDESHLYRMVKKDAKSTPKKLLLDYRMNKAKAMLEAGENNISEIAYGTGFNSLSYFSRRFKAHFGYSPSQMLKND